MKNNLFNSIHVTEKHNGKMKGLGSISTSPLYNEQCLQNRMIKGSVCEKCFSFAQINCFKKNFPETLENNTIILTNSILPLDQLPRLNFMYFRFESFGDIANETHFINYLNICKVNPQTNFAIWSKNPQIMDAVFNDMKIEKPKNLNIVISSLFLNLKYNLDTLHYKKRYWFIDKIFTVYNADFAIENNVEVNCGNKKCMECLKCYTKNDTIYINEVLKNEQKRYYKALEEDKTNE
jgi:hypothetical protein